MKTTHFLQQLQNVRLSNQIYFFYLSPELIVPKNVWLRSLLARVLLIYADEWNVYKYIMLGPENKIKWRIFIEHNSPRWYVKSYFGVAIYIERQIKQTWKNYEVFWVCFWSEIQVVLKIILIVCGFLSASHKMIRSYDFKGSDHVNECICSAHLWLNEEENEIYMKQSIYQLWAVCIIRL